MRKVLTLALLLLALPGCLGGCLFVGSFNPMLAMFLVDLKVQNNTDEPLYVTPLSFWFQKWNTLPLHRSRSFPLPLLRQTEFEILPHASKSFVYDCDDAAAEGVIIRTSNGRLLFQGEREKSAGNVTVFQISSLQKLGPPTAEQIAAAVPNQRLYVGYGLMFVALVWPFLFVVRLFMPKENTRTP